METKTASVIAASTSANLNIHKRKGKILKYNPQNTSKITLDGVALEQVENFTYLGNIIDEQGGIDVDAKERIDKSRTVFLQLKNIWNSRQQPTNIKIRIFNKNVKTDLLYELKREKLPRPSSKMHKYL
ncbi:unnamed protein product [Schistosoma mattheei]|uniref:Uncharacterized protein n=1 Tax=Schistosoma mattheei TaxID=31246 RepID=A0A183NSY4_9TREM|nr:unnamed protein product [Schistosoma mattheei]